MCFLLWCCIFKPLFTCSRVIHRFLPLYFQFPDNFPFAFHSNLSFSLVIFMYLLTFLHLFILLGLRGNHNDQVTFCSTVRILHSFNLKHKQCDVRMWPPGCHDIDNFCKILGEIFRWFFPGFLISMSEGKPKRQEGISGLARAGPAATHSAVLTGS